MQTTTQPALDATMMTALFATADEIRNSLEKVARTDGKANTITLEVENSYTDDADDGQEIIVMVNGRLGFGFLVEVNDHDRPGENMVSGNVLGFPLSDDWTTVRRRINALMAFLIADLPGEWQYIPCF